MATDEQWIAPTWTNSPNVQWYGEGGVFLDPAESYSEVPVSIKMMLGIPASESYSESGPYAKWASVPIVEVYFVIIAIPSAESISEIEVGPLLVITDDVSLYLGTVYEDRQDEPLYLSVGNIFWSDVWLYLDATDGLVFLDIPLYLHVTDGEKLMDVKMYFSVIAEAPRYQTVTALRPNSISTEVWEFPS